MPDSRPANYYLGCLGGSVFLDFNNYKENLICLKRISFDGYGCCNLGDHAIPMNQEDSRIFKEIIKYKILDQNQLAFIITKTISDNMELLWEDALNEYGFI